MKDADAFWLFDGNLAKKKEAEKQQTLEPVDDDWTAPPIIGGSDVDVPDPDEPGFDPIDRTEPEDKPPAAFFDHIRKRGMR